MTDTTGKVVQSYDYDSFGNLKDQQNKVKQPFAFTGREWDRETGLYFLRNRYYDPMEGRFISKDSIGFAGGDMDLYGYVTNNPINYTDPSGHGKFDPLLYTIPAWLLSKIINYDPSGQPSDTDAYMWLLQLQPPPPTAPPIDPSNPSFDNYNSPSRPRVPSNIAPDNCRG